MNDSPPPTLSVEIVQMGEKNLLSKFNCGETDVDRWAQRSAHKLHSKQRNRVYILREAGGETPLAFFSLSLAHHDNGKLLRQEDRDGWHYGAPFVYLDWLGVARSYQRVGLGKLLLSRAMELTAELHGIAPVYGLALRSLNQDTTTYYEKLGFRVAPDEDREGNPLMILPIFTIIALLA